VSEAQPTPNASPSKKGAPRWVFFLPLAILAVIAGVSLAQLMGPKPEPASFISPKRHVPLVVADTFDGGKIDLGGVRGPLIVNFWATWCAPCKAEHPILMKLKSEGARIIGVQHMDDGDRADPKVSSEKVRAMLAGGGNPFETMAVDRTGDISLAFGITGLPDSFLVDANGEIVKTIHDPLTGTEGEEFIRAWKAMVAESQAPTKGGANASAPASGR